MAQIDDRYLIAVELKRKNVDFGRYPYFATHSPLIMAYPNSFIYEFGKNGIKKVEYENTEQYAVYRSFFTDHRRFFYKIFKETEKGHNQ